MALIISSIDCSFEYETGNEILTQLDFTINESEMVYVRGESGSGKSTFLKLLNRLIEPSSGMLEYRNNAYAAIDPTELRRKVQLVPQTPFLFPVSVMENLKMAARGVDDGRIIHYMGMFNLPRELLNRTGKQLSVGQAARVCVIRALLLEPDVVMLDEPTAALDPKNKETFHNSFEVIRKELNMATVWVSHDPAHDLHKEGRHLVLEEGTFLQ